MGIVFDVVNVSRFRWGYRPASAVMAGLENEEWKRILKWLNKWHVKSMAVNGYAYLNLNLTWSEFMHMTNEPCTRCLLPRRTSARATRVYIIKWSQFNAQSIFFLRSLIFQILNWNMFEWIMSTSFLTDFFGMFLHKFLFETFETIQGYCPRKCRNCDNQNFPISHSQTSTSKPVKLSVSAGHGLPRFRWFLEKISLGGFLTLLENYFKVLYQEGAVHYV